MKEENSKEKIKVRIPRITLEKKEQIVKALEKKEIDIDEADRQSNVSVITIHEWLRTIGNPDLIPRKQQTYSEQEKRQIVYELQSGKLIPKEILQKYKIVKATLKSWEGRYLSDIDLLKNNDMTQKELPLNVAVQDKNAVESLKLKIAALETMIDIAETEFNIDIRKKSGSKQ